VIHEIERQGDLEAGDAEDLKRHTGDQRERRAEGDHQRRCHHQQTPEGEHPAPPDAPHQPGNREAQDEIGEANGEVEHADSLGVAQERQGLQGN
jgi:hypothetical protein